MTLDADIIVVGAGVCGLTATARLQDLGLRVLLIEQADGLRATGAGIMLHPNALACLGHVSRRLATEGCFVSRQTTIDPDGSQRTLEWSAVWPDGAVPLAIERGRLARLLLDELPEETVRWSRRPIELREQSEFVSLAFEDGSTLTSRLLIGADGVHSWVRRRVDPACAPKPLGQTFWRTTVPMRPPFDFAEWRVWRGGGRFFGAMPIGGDRMHAFVQSGASDPVRAEPDAALEDFMRLAALVGSDGRRMSERLEIDRPIDVRRVHGLQASRMARGRLAIIGDAAHAVTPATTQGAGLALGDTAALADEIALHGTVPSALDAFDRRRSPEVSAFLSRARLHAGLTSMLQQEVPGGSSVGQDPAAWYRQLYRPLMASR